MVDNSNEFSLISFKKNILSIEQSEKRIWEFHKSENIKDLFLLCLERATDIQNSYEEYKENHSHMEELLQEILRAYKQIKEVVFENNYHRIYTCLQELLYITAKQTEELNISNNLIDFTQRENILNGEKIYEYESQFTTVSKTLLKEINKAIGLNEEENGSNEFHNKNNEVEIITTENQETQIEHESLSESQNDLIEMSTSTEETTDVNIEIEEKDDNVQSSFEDFNYKVEASPLETTEEIFEKSKEKSYFIDKSKIDETNQSKDINRIIKEHFSYQDSPSLGDEEKEEIIRKSVNSKSAQKYASILLELENNEELEIYEMLGRKLFAQTLTMLDEIQIEPLPYTLSQTWVMWDIAKQLYYIKYPLESNNNYVLENPLESDEKQKEIIYRHLGWIIYKEMTSGKLDTLLANLKNSSYAKKIIDYMIDKPNKGGSLSSYKLADLGKSVVLALKT